MVCVVSLLHDLPLFREVWRDREWRDLVPWYLPCSAYNHCFSGG